MTVHQLFDELDDLTREPFRAAKAEMDAAMARGWADRDASIYLTLQEERAGIEVRIDDV